MVDDTTPQSTTISADFLFEPADYGFAFFDATAENLEALYQEAAKHFP